MTERELPPPLPSQEGDTTAAPAARNNPHQHDADEQDDDDDFEEEGSGAASPVIAFAIAIAVAVAYIGGWKITWGAFLRTKKALAPLTSGEVLHVTCTDPATPTDFTAFCKQTGNEMIECWQDADKFLFLIRKR